MHGYRLDCVATAHDHLRAHIQMGNELNTDQYNPTEDCLTIDGTPVPLDVHRGMCSTAAIYRNERLAISLRFFNSAPIQSHCYLCDDEHIRSFFYRAIGNFTSDRFSNGVFIFICPCRVNVSVAHIDRIFYRFFDFNPIRLCELNKKKRQILIKCIIYI